MRELKTDYGTIKYRVPNIPEAIELIGLMGFNSKNITDAKKLGDNDLVFIARMIKNMGEFVDVTDLKFKGENIDGYAQALNYFELMAPLSEVAKELFETLNFDSKKKS